MSSEPSSIRIGVHTYKLDISEEARLELAENESRGESRPDRALIRVDYSLGAGQKAETIIHESLHCAWAQTGLRARPFDEHQEEIVTALAPLILSLIRDNPKLLGFLTSQ